jgi:hypothetical protein
MKQRDYVARAYENNGGMITLIVDAGYPDRNVYGGYEQMPDGELLRCLQLLSLDPIADEDWDNREELSAADIDEIEDGDQLIAEVSRSGDIHMYTHSMGFAARKALAYPPEQD